MSGLSDAGKSALTAVVAAGAEECAAKLADFTHHPWSVESVTLSLDEAGPFAELMSGVAADTYGSSITFPGGSFLLLYSGKSGYLISSAFTRDFQDRVEGMAKREVLALGEASNILINPLVGRLAKAWGTSLIISAPKTAISSRRDHLTRALDSCKVGGNLVATLAVKLASTQLFSECHLLLFLDAALVEKLATGR